MSPERDFSFELKLEGSKSETDHNLGFGELEEIVTQYQDYESVSRQEYKGETTFHIVFENFVIAVNPSFLMTRFKSTSSDLLEVSDMAWDILEHMFEKSDGELVLNGNMSIVGEFESSQKLFEDIEPPLTEVEDVSALAFEVNRGGTPFGVSLNETDGEEIRINISYLFEVSALGRDDDQVTMRQILQEMFNLFAELEEEIGELNAS